MIRDLFRKKKDKWRNKLVINDDKSFNISYTKRAKKAYLWVILIMLPLPLLIVASLIFNLLEKMFLFIVFFFISQIVISFFTVKMMKPKISYVYNSNDGIFSYRNKIFAREKSMIFANAVNLNMIFVCAHVIEYRNKYLVYQLRGIYNDGKFVKLSGLEVGSPDNLNEIGRKISKIINVPLVEANETQVSKIFMKINKLGWPTEIEVKNVRIK